MGATVTTFCNETNIVLYTSLSIIFPYYSTDNLQPGYCVSYTVGRVWFTATAQIRMDTNIGYLYFPTTPQEVVGLRYGLPYSALDYLTYMSITPEEAQEVMYNASDVVADDFNVVSHKYAQNAQNLLVQEAGFYTNKNKKITITGGPKGSIYKPHPYISGKHVSIVSANFEPLKMTVTS